MKRKIRIMIVDDHQVVRMGLAAIIAAEDDMRLAGEASDGIEAVKMARSLSPDVVLMDLMMPGMNGAEATSGIVAALPEARVLVLTTFGESGEVEKAMDAGAAGALIKDTPRKDLVAAIREVARGGQVVSQEIAHVLSARRDRPKLSPRQLEVLSCVAEGLTSKAIAMRMGITQDGVNGHLRAVFAHLRASSRAEAVAIAKNLGMLQPGAGRVKYLV